MAPSAGNIFRPTGIRLSGIPAIPGQLLWGALLAALLLLAPPVAAQEQGTVSGRLIGAPAKGPLEGATVVLMWFRTNAQGKPDGGPIARQQVGKNGSFTFRNVPIDEKARYQLGIRVDGRLVGSDPFTFAAGVREQKVDLKIPEEVADLSALSIGQALYVMEPRIGRVWVTEVLHLQNSSRNLISTGDTPLEFPLPSGAEQVEVIRMEARAGNHERIGAKLQVLGKFNPGNTTIAFRYTLPAALGSITMEKRYALPISEVVVIAGQGSVEVAGGSLQPMPPRMIDKKLYDAWGAADLAAQTAITFRIGGMPAAQWIYLTPMAVFFVLMVLIVLWFVRRRLGGAGSTG